MGYIIGRSFQLFAVEAYGAHDTAASNSHMALLVAIHQVLTTACSQYQNTKKVRATCLQSDLAVGNSRSIRMGIDPPGKYPGDTRHLGTRGYTLFLAKSACGALLRDLPAIAGGMTAAR